jgi:outer membrane protein TolC
MAHPVRIRTLGSALAILATLGPPAGHGLAQGQLPPPRIVEEAAPAHLPTPAPAEGAAVLPINLPTALQLAGVRPLDIALASERIRVAAAQLERAQLLWLPTIYLGADYYRHDGQLQDVQGNVFGTSKTSFMLGAGPYAVFALSDAIFAPLAARQDLRARQAALQAVQNDTLLAVGEAYFNVQQARGELAGAVDAAQKSAELVRRTEKLAPHLVPHLEVTRARAELARRQQAVAAARERWHTAGAELGRLLRLDPAALLEPLEPPHLQVTLVSPEVPVDELIPVALTNRPELAAQQALVQATLERLRQEKLRPLIPSILLRGSSTPVTGTLAGGYFGGGTNERIGDFSARSDFDVQVLWELQNLGLGNRARVDERRAENRLAALELFRTQERVAAEVVQAHAQVRSAAARVGEAEAGLRNAVELVARSLEGLGKTKSAGTTKAGAELLLLIIRPQEAVAAVQAEAQAYADYYGAVADYDRAQLRLYRALGQPAQVLTASGPACLSPPAEAVPVRATLGAPLPSEAQ